MKHIPQILKIQNGIWYSDLCGDVSYPVEGNEACFQIEDESFWFKHRNDCICEVVSQFPPTNKGPIFDVGGVNVFV